MARQSNRQLLPPQGSADHFALWDHFREFLTPERQIRLEDVLSRRTRRVTVVLDDVRQSHNISAVLRSCDAFGIQDVHVIEPVESFDPRATVALGTDRWLTIRRQAREGAARRTLDDLRRRNYRLVATVPPSPGTVPYTELPLDEPLAVIFGNEKEGICPEVLEAADLRTTIPMQGFVESLNISVAAALVLQNLSSRIREQTDGWQLSPAEYEELLFRWTRNSVPACEFIEQRWLSERRQMSEAPALQGDHG